MTGQKATFRLPRVQVQGMDVLITAGQFVDRGDAIRTALRDYLAKEKPV